MIINEIRAYYDEFVDDQTVLLLPPPSLPLLIMIKVASNVPPWEFLSVYCFRRVNRSLGVRPSAWKTSAPGYLPSWRQAASVM